MSVIVHVSIAVSMSVSVTLYVTEFLSVSMSSVHDRFRFSRLSASVAGPYPRVSNRVRVCFLVLAHVSDCVDQCPCLWPCQCL